MKKIVVAIIIIFAVILALALFLLIRQPAQAPGTASPSATPTPSTLPAGVISWQEAAKYANQRLTVEGKVTNAVNTGKFVFLDFGEPGSFYVRIPIDVAAKFPTPPEQTYLNKTIRVAGQILLLKDGPQIELSDPSQISLVGSS